MYSRTFLIYNRIHRYTHTNTHTCMNIYSYISTSYMQMYTQIHIHEHRYNSIIYSHLHVFHYKSTAWIVCSLLPSPFADTVFCSCSIRAALSQGISTCYCWATPPQLSRNYWNSSKKLHLFPFTPQVDWFFLRNFSKVSSRVMIHGELNNELTFENV